MRSRGSSRFRRIPPLGREQRVVLFPLLFDYTTGRMGRIVIVGTGTGIGKTHVACALIRAATARGLDTIGLKPIETGVGGLSEEVGDHERLTNAAVDAWGSRRAPFHAVPAAGFGGSGPEADAFHVKPSTESAPAEGQTFHVKRGDGPLAATSGPPSAGLGDRFDAQAFHVKRLEAHAPSLQPFGPASRPRSGAPASHGERPLDDASPRGPFLNEEPSDSAPRARSTGGREPAGAEPRTPPPTRPGEPESPGTRLIVSEPEPDPRTAFHLKRQLATSPRAGRPLYAFADPISPHLAARRVGLRFDLGAIRRWVVQHERPLTIVETAGGLFSPLGHATSNFDLVAALLPAVVVLVAPDRLGVLHDVTATLGLASAKRRPVDAVVLSAPAHADASTGTNAASLLALGIAQPIALFPRAADDDDATLQAAHAALDRILRLSAP